MEEKFEIIVRKENGEILGKFPDSVAFALVAVDGVNPGQYLFSGSPMFLCEAACDILNVGIKQSHSMIEAAQKLQAEQEV